MMWTWLAYRTLDGKKVVQDWFRALPEEARDELRDVMSYLGNVPNHMWKRPWFDMLEGGIGEIRRKVVALKTQYRIYGCFGPPRLHFTCLIGATKKNGTHDPPSAKQTAKERKNEVERTHLTATGSLVHELDF